MAISDWCNVNAKGGKLMAAPLHYATVHGHTPVVERLLDKGADVGLTDANGETPLDYAAKRETEETADFLRKRGGKTSTELREERKKLAD